MLMLVLVKMLVLMLMLMLMLCYNTVSEIIKNIMLREKASQYQKKYKSSLKK